MIADSARKAAEATLNQISEAGHWNSNTFQRVLAGGPKLIARIAEAVKVELTQLATGIVGCLKLISTGEKITIPVTTGKRTIAKARSLFNGYLDSNFANWGLDVESEAALETMTEVYEMVEDSDFRKIFGGFGLNLDLLCLTQDQIIAWVETHRDWLRTDGCGTFFLFKVVGVEFFVARVGVHSGGYLYVRADRLSNDFVWDAEYGRRIVVPQLTLGN